MSDRRMFGVDIAQDIVNAMPPTPPTDKQLYTKPDMRCRIIPTHPDSMCNDETDLMLQVSNIKGVFTDDIPVCPAHAWAAMRASRMLFGSGRIVQWKAVETVTYSAQVVPEEEFRK